MKILISLLLLVLLAGCGVADAPSQPTTGSDGTGRGESTDVPGPATAEPSSTRVSIPPKSTVGPEPRERPETTPSGETLPEATSDPAEGGGGGGPGVVVGGVATAEAGVIGGNSGPLPTPTPIVGARTITFKDNQQTLELAVGETFVLKLGEQFEWIIQDPAGDVLVPTDGRPMEPGEQRLYRANSPGQAEIIATGSPGCAHSEPACMMPDMLFRLIVVVR